MALSVWNLVAGDRHLKPWLRSHSWRRASLLVRVTYSPSTLGFLFAIHGGSSSFVASMHCRGICILLTLPHLQVKRHWNYGRQLREQLASRMASVHGGFPNLLHRLCTFFLCVCRLLLKLIVCLPFSKQRSVSWKCSWVPLEQLQLKTVECPMPHWFFVTAWETSRSLLTPLWNLRRSILKSFGMMVFRLCSRHLLVLIPLCHLLPMAGHTLSLLAVMIRFGLSTLLALRLVIPCVRSMPSLPIMEFCRNLQLSGKIVGIVMHKLHQANGMTFVDFARISSAHSVGNSRLGLFPRSVKQLLTKSELLQQAQMEFRVVIWLLSLMQVWCHCLPYIVISSKEGIGPSNYFRVLWIA